MTRWRPSQELVVLVCYTVALYMTVVDNTIIYTALPSVARKQTEPMPVGWRCPWPQPISRRWWRGW